jgi:hypothetical protein
VASLQAGFSLENTHDFAARVVRLMKSGLNLDAAASLVEEEECVQHVQDVQVHVPGSDVTPKELLACPHSFADMQARTCVAEMRVTAMESAQHAWTSIIISQSAQLAELTTEKQGLLDQFALMEQRLVQEDDHYLEAESAYVDAGEEIYRLRARLDQTVQQLQSNACYVCYTYTGDIPPRPVSGTPYPRHVQEGDLVQSHHVQCESLSVSPVECGEVVW